MERPAGRGLQVGRLVLAAVFVAFSVLCAVRGSWVVAVLVLLGAAAALESFRRGTTVPHLVRDHLKPRLVGGLIGLALLPVVLGVAALLD